MQFREIHVQDIPALFEVRVATDENALSYDELRSLGITEETVAEKLAASHGGWLCEVAGRVVGFAMGDRSSGEMWVIAVLPEFIKRGIGSQLIDRVERWLWSEGCGDLWLTTDVDATLRAYSFYRNRGWVDDGIRGGNRYMKKPKTAQPGATDNPDGAQRLREDH